MSKKRIISIVLALIFFAGFLAFTYAVKSFDVQAIGPLGSEIGFADFNKSCFDAVGQNELMYEITNVIGYLAILICALFGVIGFIQLVKTKSLKKVDADLICMGILYILAIAAYVLFEIVTVNYRPVLEDGALAASYPSSHTVLAICVFGSLIVEISRRINNPGKALIEEIACLAMICLAIAGRFLSGMHWATDIIGGIILSCALISVFIAVLPEKKGCKH